MTPHSHAVQIYYEDTDHSGLVYHPNYLKYFERAREHVLGVEELVRMQREDGVGFVVYKAELTYKKGARFGDRLEVRTTVERASDYRLVFVQRVFLEEELLVDGRVEMVCVDREGALTSVPKAVLARLPVSSGSR